MAQSGISPHAGEGNEKVKFIILKINKNCTKLWDSNKSFFNTCFLWSHTLKEIRYSLEKHIHYPGIKRVGINAKCGLSVECVGL